MNDTNITDCCKEEKNLIYFDNGFVIYNFIPPSEDEIMGQSLRDMLIINHNKLFEEKYSKKEEKVYRSKKRNYFCKN